MIGTSKTTIKTLQAHQWYCPTALILPYFKDILTWNKISDSAISEKLKHSQLKNYNKN